VFESQTWGALDVWTGLNAWFATMDRLERPLFYIDLAQTDKKRILFGYPYWYRYSCAPGITKTVLSLSKNWD